MRGGRLAYCGAGGVALVDRTRLAVSGAVLAVAAFTINALIAWSEYERDLDAHQTENFEWMPSYWDYLQGGLGMMLNLLVALGVVMVLVAWTMRPTEAPDDSIFRPES